MQLSDFYYNNFRATFTGTNKYIGLLTKTGGTGNKRDAMNDANGKALNGVN
ncbi:MAG TPA: hypothetical protein VIH57_00955 [Bacteroidales bacterium]